ncbi:hypothetical protein CC78DRAFT_327852 [Lojkania enalia]|uniref:Uncharacterized protein n=1 Tax=Lojkania enalia TaxID=147567 RepID=A0A9P4N1W3_9PLEO|nr:hypothetical protein CC78DRAFT_327852 [Didymosphaeria enalia]
MMDIDPRLTSRASQATFNYGTGTLLCTFQYFTNIAEIDLDLSSNRALIFDLDEYFLDRYSGHYTNIAFAVPNHDAPLPMNSYFDAHILPVLESGSWLKLEKMVVRRIGDWKLIDGKRHVTVNEYRWVRRKKKVFRSRAAAISEAVGRSVKKTC